jgi:hypothetical protein
MKTSKPRGEYLQKRGSSSDFSESEEEHYRAEDSPRTQSTHIHSETIQLKQILFDSIYSHYLFIDDHYLPYQMNQEERK